jgi:benzaldehyde dehydrogenase (NAD)
MTQFLDKALWEGRLFDGAWTAAPTSKPVREPATGDDLARAGLGDVPSVAHAAAAAVLCVPLRICK